MHIYASALITYAETVFALSLLPARRVKTKTTQRKDFPALIKVQTQTSQPMFIKIIDEDL